PADECVHELFEAQAERTPEAVAVVCGEQALTYRELNRRANRLAHHLRGLGVGPDVPVGLYVGRSPGPLVGLLGRLQAGGGDAAPRRGRPGGGAGRRGRRTRAPRCCCRGGPWSRPCPATARGWSCSTRAIWTRPARRKTRIA